MLLGLAKERLGEQPDEEKSKSPSLEHYIQRRSGPRGLSNVDDLLGRSDPQGAEKPDSLEKKVL